MIEYDNKQESNQRQRYQLGENTHEHRFRAGENPLEHHGFDAQCNAEHYESQDEIDNRHALCAEVYFNGV